MQAVLYSQARNNLRKIIDTVCNDFEEYIITTKDIKKNPDDNEGLGKPERLKENLKGYFSRRITSEHRLIYKRIDDLIIVAKCRYYY